MRKTGSYFLIALFLSALYSSAAFAQPAAKTSDVPGKIVVEPDQTDIYAIPLDEDADEQQQELYNLEHPKK